MAPHAAPGVLRGPILPYLLRHSLRLFAGLLALASLSLVDVYFIGRLGPDPLTAVGFTTPVFLFGVNVLLSLGTGLTAILAQTIGRQAPVAPPFWGGLSLSVLTGSILSLLGYLLHDRLFGWLGASEVHLPLLREYMWALYPAFLPMALVLHLLGLVRAYGYTRLPMLVMLLIVGANLLLDPLLILGWGPFPGLGLRGAALATGLAIGLGLIVAMIGGRAWWPAGGLRAWLTPGHIDADWGEILYIAGPAALTRVLLPFAGATVTGLLARYGAPVVAAYGIGFRVDLTLLMFMIALSSVLSPFVSQNYGAGQLLRLRQGLQHGALLALAYGLGIGMIVALSGYALGRLFTQDPNILSAFATYCFLVPWGYAFNGLLMLATGALHAISRPWHATAAVVSHLLLLYLPLAALGHALGYFEAILLAYPLSHLLGSGLSWYLLQRALPSGTGTRQRSGG
ncbi:MAG: MATE family efflux transporter [Bacteroidetes bacterium]|nr:MAG: MATE family efflux transporter [Bacteroidota bacterium]